MPELFMAWAVSSTSHRSFQWRVLWSSLGPAGEAAHRSAVGPAVVRRCEQARATPASAFSIARHWFAVLLSRRRGGGLLPSACRTTPLSTDVSGVSQCVLDAAARGIDHEVVNFCVGTRPPLEGGSNSPQASPPQTLCAVLIFANTYGRECTSNWYVRRRTSPFVSFVFIFFHTFW